MTYFLFCFAVWDLFYYVFLKLFSGWLESLFSWDILFLIPVPRVGPVIAPCILSLTMILLTVAMVRHEKKGMTVTLKQLEWALFIAGTLLVITSLTWDYLRMATMASTVAGPAAGQELFSDFMNYIPKDFNWPLFLFGEILLISAIAFIARRRQPAYP